MVNQFLDEEFLHYPSTMGKVCQEGYTFITTWVNFPVMFSKSITQIEFLDHSNNSPDEEESLKMLAHPVVPYGSD